MGWKMGWRRVWEWAASRAAAPGGVGPRGEQAAAKYLSEKGYRLLKRNYRLPGGELDLVMESPEGVVVVVEVKSTAWSGPSATPPEVHVNRAKQRKISELASVMVRKEGWEGRSVRFDVVGVVLSPGGPGGPGGGADVVRHHAGAFESYF